MPSDRKSKHPRPSDIEGTQPKSKRRCSPPEKSNSHHSHSSGDEEAENSPPVEMDELDTILGPLIPTTDQVWTAEHEMAVIQEWENNDSLSRS